VYGLAVNPGSWLEHKPPPVVETLVVKNLWDFSLYSTSTQSSNHPDIVYLTIQKRTFTFLKYHALQMLMCPLRNMRSYTSINRWHAVLVYCPTWLPNLFQWCWAVLVLYLRTVTPICVISKALLTAFSQFSRRWSYWEVCKSYKLSMYNYWTFSNVYFINDLVLMSVQMWVYMRIFWWKVVVVWDCLCRCLWKWK